MMCTQEQGYTMQNDINAILLKIKELNDKQEDQLSINTHYDKLMLKHADKIDHAIDNVEVINLDITYIMKELSERLQLIDFEQRENQIHV